MSVGWKRYKALGKNLSSGSNKVTLHDFWQPRVSKPKQARHLRCDDGSVGSQHRGRHPWTFTFLG